ncbi:hypothetical protein CTAYLR_007680 [Chrysophaeum taylorii]|uniref:PHD-type domain-containing protein n=1 Tax=Chrysophaeum taylorii TaxID=2483200 RepID=A0AAD7U668_9STRA|nr:hypothetical protein CTAYLR_007680 [Chrysophaeum taylorii]
MGRSGVVELKLQRGGKITVHRDYFEEGPRTQVLRELEACGLFRQYKFGNVPEPRLHVLLAPSSRSENLSYQYHGVTMAARPLEAVPLLEALAGVTSSRFDGAEWNVGVDVVCYRDGKDSCGWHADDTQGERLVVCVVLESDGGLRKVCVRPKQPTTAKKKGWNGSSPSRKKKRRASAHAGEAPLVDGDEELEMWIGSGDAYAMDRGVQLGYEHAVPKRAPREAVEGRRMVVIMRSGDARISPESADSGEPAATLAPPKRRDAEDPIIGHVAGIREAVTVDGVDAAAVYSREELVAKGAHASTQRGVGGTAARGAESIVVSRQSPDLREADGLWWLRYTSTRRQGAGALWRSAERSERVRVFRSSSLASKWAPPCPASPNGHAYVAAAYRYDGLYEVAAAWDAAGAPAVVEPPALDDDLDAAYTFRLVRCDGAPNAASNADFSKALAGNLCVPADDVDVSLPPMRAAACGVTKVDDSRDLVDRRAAVARSLADLVALVVANESGWFSATLAPQLPPKKRRRRRPADELTIIPENPEIAELATACAFARWHAHRKLYWRFDRLTRSCPGPSLIEDSKQKPARCRVDLLSDVLDATSDDALRAMVADAKSRSIERAMAEALAKREKPADELVDADDPRVAARDRRCDLCGGDEREDDILAFGKGSVVACVHRQCAATSSEVYSNEAGDYVNVVDAVKRGRLIKCALDDCACLPKRSGATVGCCNKRCRRSYHFKCAIATNWHFGCNQTFFCDAHRGGLDHDPDDLEWWHFDCPCGIVQPNYDDGEDMCQCPRCSAWQHERCAQRSSPPSDRPFQHLLESGDYACARCLAAAADPAPAPGDNVVVEPNKQHPPLESSALPGH